MIGSDVAIKLFGQFKDNAVDKFITIGGNTISRYCCVEVERFQRFAACR